MALNSDRTAYISTIENEKKAENRTSPLHVISDGQLSLNDVINPKPLDYDKQIHISWIDDALDQKAFETKYSAWDMIECPSYPISCSCFGNNLGIAASSNGKLLLTNNHGNSFIEKDILENVSSCVFLSYIENIVLDTDEIESKITNKFILFSNGGRAVVTTDNFNTMQDLTIPDDVITSSVYSNKRLILCSSSGKIYISNDYGLTFQEIEHNFNIQFTSIAANEKGVLVAVGNNGNDRCIYSLDNGMSWQSFQLNNNNQWLSITYGENKFIACSLDGDNRLLLIEYQEKTHSLISYIQNLPYNYEFSSISYGSRVFVLVSLCGKTLSSFDGIRWLEVPNGNGSWCNILRTDKFFIVFSNTSNEDGFNACRSSNGGLLGIQFATVQEIIDNEKTNKSIDIQGVNAWFNYLEQDRGITAQDMRLTIIDENSPCVSVDEIIKPGEYFIIKNLENLPSIFDYAFPKLIVQNVVIDGYNTIFHCLYSYFGVNYYRFIRLFNPETNSFDEWLKENINQTEIKNIDLSLDNISVSKETTITSASSFLIQNAKGEICSIPEIDLSSNIVNSFNFKNTLDVFEFFKLIGFTEGSPTSVLIEKIKGFGYMFSLYLTGIFENKYISDAPLDSLFKLHYVYYDGANIYLVIKDIMTYKEFIYNNSWVESKNEIGLHTISTGGTSSSTVEEFYDKFNIKNLALKDIVETSDIKDNAVTESKILNGAVTTNKIKDNSVTESKILKGAVTTNKIKDAAVIESKILNGAVTTNKIKDAAVNNAKIAAKTITYDKLNLSCIEFYNTSSISGGYIDFHFNKSTADYTSRIMETASGKINITASSGLYVNNVKVLSNINDLLALIKSNPAAIRRALGLGTLATKSQVNLSDSTQVTGVLKAANGGFNYSDLI